MAFVVLGVLLCALKLLDVGPTSVWSWWVVLSPFAMAFAWWTWSDMSGRTRRVAMDKLDKRKDDRRRKAMVQLGIDPRKQDKRSKAAAAYRAARERGVEKIEGKRDALRQKNRDSILNSRHDASPPDATAPQAQPARREPGGTL